MNEFIKKLIERLEEIPVGFICSECPNILKCNEIEDSGMGEKVDLCGATIKQLAIEIVNQLAEEYNNGWISIDERFPENDNYILMSFANFSLPQIGRYEEDSEGGAFYLGDELETCVSQNLIVNAWQPLPGSYHPKGE